MKAIERLRARKNESKLAHRWLMSGPNWRKFKSLSLNHWDSKWALLLYRSFKRSFNSCIPFFLVFNAIRDMISLLHTGLCIQTGTHSSIFTSDIPVPRLQISYESGRPSLGSRVSFYWNLHSYKSRINCWISIKCSKWKHDESKMGACVHACFHCAQISGPRGLVWRISQMWRMQN